MFVFFVLEKDNSRKKSGTGFTGNVRGTRFTTLFSGILDFLENTRGSHLHTLRFIVTENTVLP